MLSHDGRQLRRKKLHNIQCTKLWWSGTWSFVRRNHHFYIVCFLRLTGVSQLPREQIFPYTHIYIYCLFHVPSLRNEIVILINNLLRNFWIKWLHWIVKWSANGYDGEVQQYRVISSLYLSSRYKYYLHSGLVTVYYKKRWNHRLFVCRHVGLATMYSNVTVHDFSLYGVMAWITEVWSLYLPLLQ